MLKLYTYNHFKARNQVYLIFETKMYIFLVFDLHFIYFHCERAVCVDFFAHECICDCMQIYLSKCVGKQLSVDL